MVETLYLAKPRGFCAGVVMAIQAVKEAAASLTPQGESLAVYHAIVHNDTVIGRLSDAHGVHFVESLAELEPLKMHTQQTGRALAETVVFSAHGVSPQVRAEARARGLATIDATCPLVTKVHSEAKKYAREGYHILLIGDSSRHQEVLGTQGEAPEATTVVSVAFNRKHDPQLADPETVTIPDPERVVVLTQTTLSVDDVAKTIAILKRRFPALVVPPSDDLCYATKNRQDAVRAIAPNVEMFLVVTSDYSSNGMRLLELAEDLTGSAKRIESVRDLRPEWFEGVRSLGVTSAASTPDDLVQEIVAYFRARNEALRLVEEGEWENIVFRKPKRVPAPVGG